MFEQGLRSQFLEDFSRLTSATCVLFFGGKTGLWVGSWIKTIGGETSNIFWMVSIIFYTPTTWGNDDPNLTSHIFQMAWFNHQLDVSENSGFSPKIIHCNGVFHYKSSILGYPYFWKPPPDAPWDGNICTQPFSLRVYQWPHSTKGKRLGTYIPVPWSIWWVFPKIGVPQNGWSIMENPIKMDDLGVPLFSETSTWSIWVFFKMGWNCKFDFLETAWTFAGFSTCRITPASKWLVTCIYKPFRPFGRGITPDEGPTNHGF